MNCYSCNHENIITRKIGRNDLCAHCGLPLRCCLNCKFYDKTAYHQCKEPQSEWTSDKSTANFCGYFTPGDRKGAIKNDKADEARKKLNALFGGDSAKE